MSEEPDQPEETAAHPTATWGTSERVMAAAMGAALLGVAVVVVPDVVGYASDGPRAWVCWAVALWAVTAALLATGLRLVLRLRSGGRPWTPEAGALAAVLALAVVVTAGVATWATVDRASNLSQEEIRLALVAVGDDLAPGGPPSLGEVETALAVRIDGLDPETPFAEPARGLRVVESGVAAATTTPALDGAAFQVTDDDGGSPVCLVFVPPGADAGPVDGPMAVVAPGLC